MRSPLCILPKHQVYVFKHGLDYSNVFFIDSLSEELVEASEEFGTNLVAIQVHEGLRQAQCQMAQNVVMLGIKESEDKGVQNLRVKGLGEELGIAWKVVCEVLKDWRGERGCQLYVILLW